MNECTVAAQAIQNMMDQNVNLTVANINHAIKHVNFEGVTGQVRLDSIGNRLAEYTIVNLRDDDLEVCMRTYNGRVSFCV